MGVQQIKTALELVGSQHKYQKILVLLISLAWILFNFVLLGSTFIYQNPLFKCNGSDDTISEAQACLKIQQCSLIDTFTLTYQLKLYCDMQYIRDILQAIFPLGSIAGLLVMNLISDLKGRKISIIICFYLSIIGLLVTIIAGHLKLVSLAIIAQFITGFGIFPLVPLSYTVLSDFCNVTFKSRAVIIVNTAWSASTVLLGFIYLIEMNWFLFISLVILLPLIIIAFLMERFLYEPPFILINQNKKQQALRILLQVAKINKTYDQNRQKIKLIIQNQQFRNLQNKASFTNIIKIILKKSDYLKTIVVLSAIRVLGAINFFGSSYAFTIYGLGLGYNSIYAGIVELFAFIFLTYTINKLPRKKGISIFYLCVSVIGFMFFFPFISQNKTNGTILMVVSRFFSTVSYTLIASVQTQAFTAQIQSTAMGIAECFGLVGAMMGPLIVDWSQKIGVNAITVIAILVTFAVWLPIFLRQTLTTNKKVEDQKQNLLQNAAYQQNNAQWSQVQSQKQSINNYDILQHSQKSIITTDQ